MLAINLETIEGFYDALFAGNLAGALAYFADNVTYEQHISRTISPAAGRVVGIEGLSTRIAALSAEWKFEQPALRSMFCNGSRIRAAVDARMRYRATGNAVDIRLQHVFRLNDDALIQSLDEYHDDSKLAAFMALNATTQASKNPSWANSIDALIGARITRLRTERGINRAAIAEHLDISIQDVAAMELGRQRISSEQLFDLAHFLAVSISAFFSDQ